MSSNYHAPAIILRSLSLLWICVVVLLLLLCSSPKGAVHAFVAPSSLSVRTTTPTTAFLRNRFDAAPRTATTTTKLQMAGSSGLPYSELMEKLPSPKVIEAVEKSKDGSVIASDLAASAGISLSQARKDLTALASLSQGDIAVTRNGELLYKFPSSLSSVLASNSAKYKAMQTFRKAWPFLFWGIRVSFGIVLLVSLVAIFSTILFISASGGGGRFGDDDDRDDDRGFGGGNEFGRRRSSGLFGGGFWGPSPFDFLYYRPYYGSYYYDPYPLGIATGRGSSRQRYRDPDDMGFLESIFSYVFGDGNPNEGIEERRLQLASNMIRANNGAVTAEQLAVYCDIDDDGNDPYQQDEDGRVDESFVLPIVTALGGEPQVTDDGDIIYVFPEMQLTTTSSSSQILERVGLPQDASNGSIKSLLKEAGISTRGVLERSGLLQILSEAVTVAGNEEDASILIEKPYKFSLAPDFKKLLAGGLGIINLGGALYLGNLLGQMSMYAIRLPSYYGIVQGLYPFLLGYAVLFNAIPLIRNFWIQSENSKIQQRNEKRRKWKTWLSQGSGSVRRKLQAARNLGLQMKRLGGSRKSNDDDEIVYDTSKQMEEIQQDKAETDLKDFDRLLEENDEMLGGFQ